MSSIVLKCETKAEREYLKQAVDSVIKICEMAGDERICYLSISIIDADREKEGELICQG